MAGVEAIGISKPRTDPDDVDRGLRGKGTMVTVSKLELDQAQLVVMNNNAEVQPYITDHMELLQSMVPRNQKNKQKWVADQHRQTFIGWLRNTIISKLNEPNHGVSDVLSRIALGPTFAVAKHEAYIVRGKRFHTKSRDDAREVQNSGIRIVAETMNFASAKDRNPVLGTMTYYGVIEEIWELNYFAFRIPLFKCSWVDNNVGVKTDELGFTLVDLSKRGSKNDPFIMASQAAQVFYISDPANDKWSIVLSTPERRFLETEEDEENADLCYDDFIVGQPIHEQLMGIDRNIEEDNAEYIRNDINEGIWGKRVALEVNDKGQYYGKSYAKLVSTLGVRCRQTIGFAYKNRKEVNQTLKNKVWKDIQTGFIVPDTFKHDCLILAGKLMKDFKNRMTKDIIMPALKENDLGRLAQVPEKHPEIDAADWCKFVESRLTPEFLELSKVQRERSSKIQSRHRSGRSGMVNVREAVKKDLEVADPPRHRVWIKSRTKSRKLVTDYDKEIAEKIVSIY
ncbi:uncharacterized protein LOC133039120 [Cannabis sativa]|uniref:uncharacterized protein LOC133039120 n=3 Tax=Cannabis sativa TaxID=3483 RepID=UPI0029CA787D|nr:uncharacterized protein LOC133039120 [Cannabis sativa]